jgi:ABC-type sugar transport system ATPase subunit
MRQPFIKLTGISKSFAGVHALQDVDMTIYEGEPVAWRVKTAAANQR